MFVICDSSSCTVLLSYASYASYGTFCHTMRKSHAEASRPGVQAAAPWGRCEIRYTKIEGCEGKVSHHTDTEM